MVNKQVLAVLLLNKAKSLFITEPLNNSFAQNAILLLKMFSHGPGPEVSALQKETSFRAKPSSEYVQGALKESIGTALPDVK